MRCGMFGVMICLGAVSVSVAQAPSDTFDAGAYPGGQSSDQPRVEPAPNLMFSVIDIDGDGIITRAELRKAVANLRKLDTDGDGNITLAEASAPGGAVAPPMGDPAQMMIDRLMENDRNRDGKLSGDELQGPMAQRLLRDADQNGDQVLDRDELAAAVQNLQNQFGGGPAGANQFQQRQGGQGGFRAGARGGAFDPQQMTARLMQFDADGDGKLSAEELPPQARAMLRGADLNNDGLIEPGEVQAVIQRMGERFRANMGRQGRGNLPENNIAPPEQGGPAGQGQPTRQRRPAG